MNNLPNIVSRASKPRYIIIKPHHQQHYEDADDPEEFVVAIDDNTTALELEVLSDEFAVDSNDEGATSSTRAITTKELTNNKPAQWSRAAIYFLIGCYKRMARDETNGVSNFGPTVIWTQVSQKLLHRGFNCTPEQCRTKWSLLKKLYQHIRNVEQLKKFEFVHAIHDYYKNPQIERLLTASKNNAEKTQLQKEEIGPLHTELGKGKKIKLENCAKISIEEDNHLKQLEHEKMFNNAVEEETSISETSKLEIDQNDYKPQAPLFDVLPEINENAEQRMETVAVNENNIQLLQEFKDIIASQEQRREERHNEKLRIFKEYNERLLAQQEVAIMVHKQLMERLIANL